MNNPLGTGNIFHDILLVAIAIVLIALFFAAIAILKAFRGIILLKQPDFALKERQIKQEAKQQRKQKRGALWNRIMGLKPISEEKDLMIDHAYDGIVELDNPVPMWFNGMFYASIAFGVVYLLTYHVFGWGLTQEQEYDREIARAEVARQEWLATAANNIDESNVEVDLRPEIISAGIVIYDMNCAVCHGGSGEGGIGPNLVDEYWLHGGEISDLFRIVKYGVPDKGMVPWEQSLSPAQIAQVSNYILSLRGTNPPNQKEPQGPKVIYESE